MKTPFNPLRRPAPSPLSDGASNRASLGQRKTRRYGLKIFFLSFLFSSLLAPGLAFGMTWLGYLLTDVESLRSLESLALLDADRAAVFAVATLVASILLGIAAFALGRAMRPRGTTADAANGRLTPFIVLLLSLPLLLLADQAIFLYLLDNPFAAARHLLMASEGWGAAILFWQVLFILCFFAGSPKAERRTTGLNGKQLPSPYRPN